MICPVKTCRVDIDDDSKYCDQCGAEILMCPKCGTPGTGKFCAKDGNKLESQKKNSQPVTQPQGGSSSPQPVVQPHAGQVVQQPPVTQQAAEIQSTAVNNSQALQHGDNSKTGDINFKMDGGDELVMVHSGGLEIRMVNNDLLGRGDGPHAQELGNFKFLSRRHAVVFRESGTWFIKDLGSTNKTKVNGASLEPEKGCAVKKGDIIALADQEFTVK